jgi:hypothetical protein
VRNVIISAGILREVHRLMGQLPGCKAQLIGYAYYSPLYDDFLESGGQPPHLVGELAPA